MSSPSSPQTRNELRRRLYDLIDDPDLEIGEKTHRALELGCEFLGVGNGYIQRRHSDRSTDDIVASVGTDPDLLPAGTVIERSTSYCRRTVESDSPIALSNTPEQGWAEDPAYREHGLECYLGTTIFVRGDVYGTVCFVDKDARGEEFTSAEKAFVELIARLLGRELEANEYDQEIKEAKRKRSELENRYETLLEMAPDAIFVTDEESGEIIRANQKAAELTGYSCDKLEGMAHPALHPPEQHDRYRRLLSGDEVTTRDRFDDGTVLCLRRADSSEIDIEVSTSIVELGGENVRHCIVRDISRRREREQELRVKNRAIEAASVGITIADATDDDLPLVYANTEFEQLTGYKSEEIQGKNCRFLQGESTDERAIDQIRQAVAGERPVTTEILNYRADGSRFWNELTVAPVTGANGDETTHFVGFQQDITPRKRQERSLAVLDRVLRHNLRNEMSAIGGFSRVIAQRADGELAEMAGRITDRVDRLTEMSEKARELQKAMRATELSRPRDIVADVEAVVDTLEAEYPDVAFTVDAVEADRVLATERLRSALEEIGDNAARHASSPVTFRIEGTDSGQIAVQVSDSGPGLSETEQQVIEAGRETALEHGDGLGLWLVNWIVTDLGGEVKTTAEDGTTVTLLLPRAGEDQSQRQESRSPLHT